MMSYDYTEYKYVLHWNLSYGLECKWWFDRRYSFYVVLGYIRFYVV